MSMKRSGRDDSGVYDSGDATPMLGAALLAGAAGKADPHPKGPKSDDERMHIFWRVFGGTILSIVALSAITLFNNLTSSISELRADITRLNEARAEMVKKDEFNTRISTSYERIQGLQAQNTAQNATLAGYRTELDGIKERMAGVESVRKDLAVIEALKERLTTLAADAKVYRDEYQKLRQDVDKNQAADQERKTRRDEQHREVEKSLKEMLAAIQACEVKLARLEGQQAKPAAKTNPTRTGPAKPTETEKKEPAPAAKPSAGDDKSGE